MIAAMILAAGMGQRMKPITLSVPKVMVPLNGIPLINYHLQWLKKHNIYDVVINLHYLGFKIEEYLGDGSRFGAHITYSHEEKLLGTAGAVKRAVNLFDSTFVVQYGDVLTNLNLSKMMEIHRNRGAAVTLVLHRLKSVVGKGVVTIDRSQRIVSFQEKPSVTNNHSALVNGGVYILNRDILSYIDSDQLCDFGIDVFPRILKVGLPIYAYLLGRNEYLKDIGTLEMYREANRFVADHQESFWFT
jgi:mannose-1-phosphate guanylyltransferase/phosphomannomutase